MVKYVKTEYDKERDREILLIKKTVKDLFKIDISIGDCISMWSEYSESACAGWISVTKEGIAHAFIQYGPLKDIDNLLLQISGMDRHFRLMLLQKLNGKYCLGCGEPLFIFCKKCNKDMYEDNVDSNIDP